jgi:two-component system nitrate/nitrite response regulator NarL
MPEKLGILVLAADTLVRDGLCALLRLEGELELVGILDSTNAIAAMEVEMTPDVVLLDIDIDVAGPESGFASSIARIHRRWPHTRVVSLTFKQEDTVLEGTLRAGADVYLRRSDTGRDLTNALRGVRRVHRSDVGHCT